MRCANCGNELKAGSLYCDVCGHPVQIVPDYNEFDDYLDNLVGNDDRRTDGQKTAKPVSDAHWKSEQAGRCSPLSKHRAYPALPVSASDPT